MNAIKPAVAIFILALGIAGAATVAPAAARLQPAALTEHALMNQDIDTQLPTITIVARRMSAAEKARAS